MKNNPLKFLLIFLSVGIISILLHSCANQQPPSGGDDDLSPPVVRKISPAPNTVNFTGTSILIEFDEYVDRRSFEESLFISPRPEEMRVNYGGTDVELEFPKGLERNRTYSVTITRDLKDLRGGNKLAEPIQFAFSTGSVIDKGNISGRVHADTYERLIIAAYFVTGSNIDPAKTRADFLTQADDNGNYSFKNLPNGKFRLFAIRDNDRNTFFDDTFDKIAVLSKDYTITDTGGVKDADFLIRNIGVNINDASFLDTLRSIDTLNFISSSLINGERGVPANNRFYFYFRNNTLSRTDIADNLKLIDTTSGAEVRIAYNWLNDSLLQVFPVGNLSYSANLRFVLDFRRETEPYYNVLNFKVIEESNTGKISGTISFREAEPGPVLLKLISTAKATNEYTLTVENDSVFTFSNIPEGDYMLFAFIDANRNGSFDKGTANPFSASEPFIIYKSPISLRGSWSIDNVFLVF